MSKREISLVRAKELRSRIDDYLAVRGLIPKGLEQKENIKERQKKIKEFFGATEEEWNDYYWQLKNRISDVDKLKKFINLSDKEVEDIRAVGSTFRWAISPYYLSLIDPEDSYDPIKLLSVPSGLELAEDHCDYDPMGEEFTNPAGSITRRYPDRLIINVTNECSMYCRHCQRRRNIGQKDMHKTWSVLQESIQYIRDNDEIRDVLITGGDALTLTTESLEQILKELRTIPHLEIIRLGSRTPVTMPQRITDELCDVLKKYGPIYLNSHFNHPMEVTEEVKVACEKLSFAGVPLGNQAVLLNGINNDKYVMRCLNQELLKVRVKPYYIFHAKHVHGTTHFNTSVDDGIEIMEYLRGYTSGMAIPTYIINAPGGNGKTPILPQYLISRGKDHITIRTWEGKVIQYENHETKDIKSLLKL